jgi:hypothetical protein
MVTDSFEVRIKRAIIFFIAMYRPIVTKSIEAVILRTGITMIAKYLLLVTDSIGRGRNIPLSQFISLWCSRQQLVPKGGLASAAWFRTTTCSEGLVEEEESE